MGLVVHAVNAVHQPSNGVLTWLTLLGTWIGAIAGIVAAVAGVATLLAGRRRRPPVVVILVVLERRLESSRSRRPVRRLRWRVGDRPFESHFANETRHCDICQRDIKLDALKPGWTVVRVHGEPAWSCPDCSRPANARR